jgi:hypothetical protein
MAKKRNLSDLIAEETQQPELSKLEEAKAFTSKVAESVSHKVPNFQTHKPTDYESPKLTELQTTEATKFESTVIPSEQSYELSNSVTHEVPKYLTLVRKETRLRSDQLDYLTSLTRSLNRKRKASGERITENTLIRVAIDLLIDKSNKLEGTTEEELSASVGLD